MGDEYVTSMKRISNNSKRFTEYYGKNGEIGLLEGAQVVSTALDIIKFEK